ncbi:MAG: hypothetical protein CL609_15415 [Anaerolineaceae bacterium]|nr:hypothetical protein [Anaerolineaceae bacterium]
MNKNKNLKKTTKHNHNASKKRNKLVFIGIILATLGMAGVLLTNAFFKPALPTADNVIDISADMGGFDKQEIKVKVGEPVTIRLRSQDNSHHTDGGGKHQWAVDEFNVSVIAQPLSAATTTFTPNKPGTYIFYCDICCGGRANPSMSGKLIVEG